MKVTERKVLGKKTKSLRKSGLVPAVIYGQGNNISIQVPVKDFEKEYSTSGHTSIVKTELGDKKFNVLIDHVQRHPVTNFPIHATLREVNLKEEINATVPIEYINEEECAGVKEQGGVLVINTSEVEIISLPTNIPHVIKVDVKNLKIGEDIKLENIKLPEGVRFATEDENILGQIAVTVTEKVEEVITNEPLEVEVAEGTKEKKEESAETE